MINSFDIETFENEEKLVPYCTSIIIGKKEKVFFGLSCIDELINHLEEISLKAKREKRKKLYIFSHNLTFDASIIIQNIKKNVNINGLFFKGNVYFLEIIFEESSIILKCSYRFFPTKLEKAEKILKTSEKIDFNHKIIKIENFKEYRKEVETYCLRDAWIVIEIIEKYNKIFSKYIKNWIDIGHSLPGISLKIFERNFNTKKIKTDSTKEEDFLFRNAYFGGRCEVFGNPREEESIYHFDFTGMYAQIMKEKFNFGEYELIEKPEKICENGFFYIKAFSSNEIPILPHHSKKNSKLLFTNGYIEGLYWHEEIILFIKMGGVVLEADYWIKFKENDKIFSNFVNNFSEMRKIDTAHNAICKYIVNSIYGRLGMSEIKSETKLFKKEEYREFYEKKEKKIIKENWINDLVFLEYEKKKKSENLNSNVMLAATITAKARIKLYKGFLEVIKNHGRILYCDTDSIFAAFEKNVDNCKFGEIFFDTSKNDTKIEKAAFALPKAYSIIYSNGERKTKIKGFNNIEIEFDEFNRMMRSEKKIKLTVESLKKANYVINSETKEKILNLGGYSKRIFSKDYSKTKPLFKEEELYFDEQKKLRIKEDKEFISLYNEKNLIEKKTKFEIDIIKEKNSLTIEIMNTKENLICNTIAIEEILLNGLFNKEFNICKRSNIFKKLIKLQSLFYKIEFLGEEENIKKVNLF